MPAAEIPPAPEDPSAPELDVVRIVTALDRHGVEYVIVGGLAAVGYGAARLTNDADCVVRHDPVNLDRLARAMQELGARLEVEGMTDDEAKLLPVQLDARTLASMEISTWMTDAGGLDVLADIPAGDGRRVVYEELASRANLIQGDGFVIRAAAPGRHHRVQGVGRSREGPRSAARAVSATRCAQQCWRLSPPTSRLTSSFPTLRPALFPFLEVAGNRPAGRSHVRRGPTARWTVPRDTVPVWHGAAFDRSSSLGYVRERWSRSRLDSRQGDRRKASSGSVRIAAWPHHTRIVEPAATVSGSVRSSVTSAILAESCAL